MPPDDLEKEINESYLEDEIAKINHDELQTL